MDRKLLAVVLLTTVLSTAPIVYGQENSTSFSSSIIPSKLYDQSKDALRQKCLALFPELKDPELTNTELPELTTTEPPELTSTAQPELETTTFLATTSENALIDDGHSSDQPIGTTAAPMDSDLRIDETTPSYDITTTESGDSPTTTDSPLKPGRKGKQLDVADANLIADGLPSASTDELISLIMDLNQKIKNLESTQRALHESVDELQKKLENTPQVMKQNETISDLTSGDPSTAVEKWKELAQNVSSAEELGNVTKTIVEEALDQGAPPTGVMDFVDKLPSPAVQESAYDTVCDKLNGSEKIQEQLYWKDMSPYCQQAAKNIGPQNPSTIKMYNVQNQIRLNAFRPIAQTSSSIQYQQYQPAVFNWLTMVRDIPDSPPQLEINMQKVMLQAYAGNPVNLPFAFHFILILPQNQGHFKQVAYKCLTQEMKANGHYYNPNEQQPLRNRRNQNQDYY